MRNRDDRPMRHLMYLLLAVMALLGAFLFYRSNAAPSAQATAYTFAWQEICAGPKHVDLDTGTVLCYEQHKSDRGPDQITPLDWTGTCPQGKLHDRPLGNGTLEVSCFLRENTMPPLIPPITWSDVPTSTPVPPTSTPVPTLTAPSENPASPPSLEDPEDVPTPPAPTDSPAQQPQPTSTPLETPEPVLPTSTPIVVPPPLPPVTGTNPLQTWKLTLPVDSDGELGGTAMEVRQPLLSSYSSEYMERRSDDSFIFRAPVQGATTSGSDYTRSELREMVADGSDEAAWTPEQGGYMQQRVAVLGLPTMTQGEARVIIGQIHGLEDEPARLYFYGDGSLSFADDRSVRGDETLFPLLDASGSPSRIPLGAAFTYTLEMDSTGIRATVVYNNVTYTAFSPLSDFWRGKAMYFKAGAYSAVAPPGSGKRNEGTGASIVQFFGVNDPVHPHIIGAR